MSWRRGQTYSQDLRDRVLTAQGSARAAACRLGVSVSCVVKALLRKAAPGTREALWNTIGASLDRYSSTECKNHIRHRGYGHPA
jgi:hypothetical protein